MILLNLCLCGCCIANEQTNKYQIDSLESQLKVAKNDTTKLQLLNKLMEVTKDNNHFKELNKYALEEMDIAKVKGNNHYLATAYNDVGMSQIFIKEYQGALVNLHTALEMRLAQKDTIGLGGTMGNIGLTYLNMNKYSKAYDTLLAAKDLLELVDYKPYLGIVNFNLALLYKARLKPEKSIASYKTALEYFEPLNNKRGMLACYLGLEHTFKLYKDYEKAELNAVQALRMATDLGLSDLTSKLGKELQKIQKKKNRGL